MKLSFKLEPGGCDLHGSVQKVQAWTLSHLALTSQSTGPVVMIYRLLLTAA